MSVLAKKQDELVANLRNYGNLAVAFSGGVDSTFLLCEAARCVPGSVIAITAATDLFPRSELESASLICKELGVEHVILDIEVLGDEDIARNPIDRCYHCKRLIFESILDAARARGINVVAEGQNLDDSADFRPGTRAIGELGIASPLLDAKLTKQEIRELSEQLGLQTAGKPAMACLATRFLTGHRLDPAELSLVERSEERMRELGFLDVRVRMHVDGQSRIARIELPEGDMAKIMDSSLAREAVEMLKAEGFDFVALDMEGYRMGSMNSRLSGDVDENAG